MLLSKKSNILILIFSVLSIFIAIFPLAIFKTKGIFFTTDPDVVYVTNALLYIRSHIVYYTDHPGTPLVLFTAFTYWPFRIYAKIIAHQPFIEWSFLNFSELIVYSRVVQAIVFGLSVSLFLKAVSYASKSKLSIIIGWLSLFIIGIFPYIGIRIYAESAMFLVISVWLLIYSYFEKHRSPLTIAALSFVAGIGIAIKFNSIVLLIASLVMVFSLDGLKIRQRIYNLVLNVFVVSSGFVIGTWPIRARYSNIFSRITKIIGRSGTYSAHGAGTQNFLDVDSYLNSLAQFVSAEKYIVIAFLFVASACFLRYFVKGKKEHLKRFLLVLSTLLSSLFIIKYSITFYQLPNLIIFAYIFSVAGVKNNKILKLLIIIIFIPIVFGNLERYKDNIIQNIRAARQMEEKTDMYPTNEISLWDYKVPTEEFAYLWTRDYAGRLFDDQLRTYRPDIAKLNLNFESIKTAKSQEEIFDVCWKRLFITERRAKEFLAKYKDKKFRYLPLVEKKYGVIESNHCPTKP